MSFPTRRALVAVALSLGLLVLAGAPGRAGAGSPGAKYLLAVGVDDYASNNIPSLQYAVSDCKHFYDALYRLEAKRFSRAEVAGRFVLMTSRDALKPTRANVIAAFRRLAAGAKPQDQFWFYFSGHGVDLDGVSCLVPYDFRISDPSASALSTRVLRGILDKECHSRQKILVLDACHSGSARDLKLVNRTQDLDSAKGVVTFAACATNQCAYEFPGVGGVFSYTLVGGLLGRADTDGDGTVTTAELKSYLPSAVSQAMQHLNGGVQTPQIIDRVGAVVPLCFNDAEALQAEPAPSGHHLTSQSPLPPGVLIAMSEMRLNFSASFSNIAETSLKKAFVEGGFPVYDSQISQEYRHALNATMKAALLRRLHVGYIVRGRAETQARRMAVGGGMITVTATITAEMADPQGNVIDAETIESDPKLAGTEGAAAKEALTDAVSKLADAMVPAARKAFEDTLAH